MSWGIRKKTSGSAIPKRITPGRNKLETSACSVVGWGNTVGFCEEIMKIWEQGQFLVLNNAGIGHLQKNFQGAQKCYVSAKILALTPKTPTCFAGLPQNSIRT